VTEQRMPQSGDVIQLGKGCGVPWEYLPTLVRVIRMHDWTTSQGMAWIDVYQLNADGDAVARRSVYVQVSGIKWLNTAPGTLGRRRPRNEGPKVPRPRKASEPTTPNGRNP
jgi:hypothetical protein